MQKVVKDRNINIDLVKVIAVFSVISIHFFLNNNFYHQPVNNLSMVILSIFRMLFTVCVPLFLIVTGYLMKDKQLNKKYYFGVLKTYFIYLIITIMILLYQKLFMGIDIGIKSIISHVVSFDVGYCWYIEMYLGLFILIPFLNILYNNINSRRVKQYLIMSMMFVTTIPAFVDSMYSIFPNWWVGIYPITYYFIGCYLREYKIDLSKFKLLLIIFGFWILGGAFSVWRNYNINFVNGDNWNNIFTFGLSISLFIFINNINFNKVKSFVKKIIIKISELSLGIYLSSYIADDIVYEHIFSGDLCNIKYYFVIVPIVFAISFIISFIANIMYKIIDKLVINKIKSRVIND